MADKKVSRVRSKKQREGDIHKGVRNVEAPNEEVHEVRSFKRDDRDTGDGGTQARSQGDPRPRRSPNELRLPITWRTEKRKIGDLIEWEKNPRRLTVQQATHLEQSLRKFGYVEECVVNADGKSIIGGHQRRRVLVAQAIANPNAMIEVRIPSRHLTEEESEELAIRLNKNTGEWDWDALANNFDAVKLLEWGFETREFGMGDPDPTPSEETHSGHGERGNEPMFFLKASDPHAIETMEFWIMHTASEGKSPMKVRAARRVLEVMRNWLEEH
jgi:hypothetical protein